VTDTATLTGAYQPTGTIEFRLYPTADCSGPPADDETVPVTGNRTYTTPTGATPAQAGTYTWTASYSGDASNTGAATSCGTDSLTLTTAAPAITQNATGGCDHAGCVPVPPTTDTATLSGGDQPTGTIEFRLYSQGNAPGGTCFGTPVADETVTVTGNGAYTTPTGYTNIPPGMLSTTPGPPATAATPTTTRLPPAAPPRGRSNTTYRSEGTAIQPPRGRTWPVARSTPAARSLNPGRGNGPPGPARPGPPHARRAGSAWAGTPARPGTLAQALLRPGSHQQQTGRRTGRPMATPQAPHHPAPATPGTRGPHHRPAQPKTSRRAGTGHHRQPAAHPATPGRRPAHPPRHRRGPGRATPRPTWQALSAMWCISEFTRDNGPLFCHQRSDFQATPSAFRLVPAATAYFPVALAHYSTDCASIMPIPLP